MYQPKVYVDYPDSFAVIDFLNAHAVEMGFKLIDLATMRPIESQLFNLVELGITFLQPKLVAPMGFPVSDGLLKREYVTQAVLKIVDLQPSSDSKTQEVVWELFVEDADNLDLFLPVADLITKEFGRAVVINLYSKDDDSAHMEPEPVDPNFPNSPLVCRIVPKTNKEKE